MSWLGTLRPGGVCIPATVHVASPGTEQAVDTEALITPTPSPLQCCPPSSPSASARASSRPLAVMVPGLHSHWEERNHSPTPCTVSATRVRSGLQEERVESVQMELLNQPHALYPEPRHLL